MNVFCTIVTADYFPYSLTQYGSLTKYGGDAKLYVLVADANELPHVNIPAGIKVIFIDELRDYQLVKQLYDKYAHINPDHFRWSLKPVFLSYLLEKGIEKVLYIDYDLHFFNSYTFLFDELNEHSVILTPHWLTKWPHKDEDAFIQLITTGVFNAGFVGCNQLALPAMNWWAEACHFRMGHSSEYAVHDDQKYLDLLPVLFERVKVITHKGCNLMAKNDDERERIYKNGEVLIGGTDPVVFIHFHKPLIRQIIMGFDPLLVPYFDQYKEQLQKNGISEEDLLRQLEVEIKPSLLNRLKWKLHLRTRIKALLYSLAKKL